jgi:hypothetical protein
MCKAVYRILRFRFLYLFHSFVACVSALMCFLLLPGTACAADEREGLKEELNKLNQENVELREQLESQKRAIENLTNRLESLEQKAPVTSPQPEEVSAIESVKGSSPFTIQNHHFQWFGDVDFRDGGKVSNGNNMPNTFFLGQLGLMTHSRLSENVSVMSEIVFQYKDDESASTTIERLQLQYQVNDLVNFRLGRTHTPFGYWNETFHHGTWYQTTVLRPELLRFHDGGSVLPIHSVGLEMYGSQPLRIMDIQYNFGVANGRGKKYTDTEDIQDLNSGKAVYGVVSLAPVGVPGLRFGVNAYQDVIPPDPSTPVRNGDIDELIAGVHLIYIRDNLEILSEAMHIQHDDRVSSRRFGTWGMYLQAGYQIDAFKPYYRFDRLDVAEGDPFYGPQVVDITRHTLGLRWDFVSRAALKFEIHYIDQYNLSRPYAFYTQAAFTF